MKLRRREILSVARRKDKIHRAKFKGKKALLLPLSVE